jgi:uncharacterized protein (TIGR03086 family)
MQELADALDLARDVVARVDPGQWDLPTPCPDWSVRQLVNHLVSGQLMFARIFAGEALESVAGMRAQDQLGDDPVGAYDSSAQALLEAVARPGALAQTVRVPMGTVPGMVAVHLRIVEALVHGWDLARATGQPFEVPAALAAGEIAFSKQGLAMLSPDRRPFGDPQPVPDQAPAIDHLAALLGRSVT